MSQARVLYDLQQIDSEIRAKKHRLGEVIRLQREPATLVAARERVREADAELHLWRARHKDLSFEIATIADKAKRSEQRLYSGNIKNTKELSDLQHEVEALGRRRAALEDEALAAMLTVDERQSAKAAADSEVERLSAEYGVAGVTLKQEQQTLALHLNRLLEKRERQAALAQPAPLRTYDQISKQKNGLAVAGLRAGKCQGCLVTVSANTIRAAGEGQLVQCDSCGRLLCPL